MATSDFVVLFHGVNGVLGDAPAARDGGPPSVFPAVLRDAHVEAVGMAKAFELDPAMPSRSGEWSGLTGTVEVLSPRERRETELLVVRCGGGYRVLFPEADEDRLVFRVPVTPGPSVDRGPFGAAVRWIMQKVVVPAFGDAATEAGGRVIGRWESARRPSAMRHFTGARFTEARAEPVTQPLRGGRTLLLLHGINAQSHDRNGFGGLPRTLVEQLNREYDHVIAWDHPTLATSPADNAADLARWLADGGSRIAELDILCHSRGGLVARSLVEHQDSGITFGSVTFVATPHRGTELADVRHLSGLVDRLLTLAFVVPDHPVGIAVEGALTIAKELSVRTIEQLEGVTCMQPGNAWLETLKQPPDTVTYRAIASDFEAVPGSGVWHTLRDRAADVVFAGTPNDLIVPTLSAVQLGDEPGVGFTDVVVYDEADSIVHGRYFDHRLVEPVLAAWLKPTLKSTLKQPPTQLPASVAHRLRTDEDLQALAKIGAEWTFAQKVTDLACFAPPVTRPAVQASIERFNARIWSALTGRDSGAPRSTAIIVPGIMGSELCAGDRRIWLSPWRLAQGAFRSLRLDEEAETPVTATEVLCFAYRRLLEHLRASYDVVEFPYDWRQPIEVAAAALVDVLRALAADPTRDDGEITHIVAHSMGGLVVRRARQLAAASDDDPFQTLQAGGGRIVLLGTPNRGSFGTPLALTGSHPLVSNLARLDVCLTQNDWLQLIWTFPGLVQLLPDPEGLPSLDDDVNRLDWLYETDHWSVCTDRELVARHLGRALETHNSLREDRGEGLYVVLGDGLPTPTGLRQVGSDQFEVEVGPGGDGTVATSCGKLDEAIVYLAPTVSHAELVRDKKVLASVTQLLDSGATRLLPKHHGDATRGGSAPAHLWLTPEQAELTLDGSVDVSRGPAPTVVRPPAWSRRDVTLAGLDAVARLLPRPVTDESPDLRISVVHASLECATYPVLVGHGTGTPIAGAEERCNELLGRHLSELNVLGSYPDVRGSHLYVPWTRPEHRIEGCVVVALDSTAPLSTGELSEHICAAVVDYAERTSWERLRDPDGEPGPRALGLSAVPVGSGPGLALGIERSIDAIVGGVQRANTILYSQNRPVVQHLEFVERYTGKVERIMQVLHRTQERLNAAPQRLGRIDLGNGRIEQKDGALAGIPPPSYDGGRWERLSVEVDKTSLGDGNIRRLWYRFAHDRAAISERPRRVDTAVVVELLREAVLRPSRCAALGTVLFEELLPAELKDELARVDNLVLQLDANTADIPWELLVDRLAGLEPFACRAGLLRQFRTTALRPRPRAAIATSALVLGDPPSGLSRLPGARQEANDVWRLMRGRSIEAQLLQFDDRGQDGGSSAARIKEAFRARDHRVIHVAAHGLYQANDQGDEIAGGVVIGDGAFLTADDFANLRIAPDLVFLNCCHLGRLRPGEREVDGLLDSVEHHRAAASIANRLMEIGVKAVIVAGWTVGDEQGHRFAVDFYREMLDGKPYGDAVRSARSAVFRQFEQADNTWAAYQCYGDPGFQLATPQATVEVPGTLRLRSAASRQLEELYVRAGESDDVDTLVARLSELDTEVAQRWPNDGELLSLCGGAWADLGRFEEATARYERAVTNGGGAPLRAVEQLVNIAARQAAMMQRRGDADDEVMAYVERAEQWAKVVDMLGGTSERRSIRASLCKRLIFLRQDDWHENLVSSIRFYTESAISEADDHAVDERSLYGFRNAIQLASVVADDPSHVKGLLTREWIGQWAADLCQTGRSGDFWQHVGRADSMLTAAFVPASSVLCTRIESKVKGLPTPGAKEMLRRLLRASVRDVGDEITDAYLAVRPRGRVREWSSVIEHLELMRDIAQARGHPDEEAVDRIGAAIADRAARS